MANASFPSTLGASIQTAELDDSAVTTAKIADGAVTTAKVTGIPLVAIQESIKGSNQTISTTYPAWVDVTALTLTLPTKTGGKAKITFHIQCGSNVLFDPMFFTVVDNGINQEAIEFDTDIANSRNGFEISYVTTLSGQVVKLAASTLVGTTITVYGVTGDSGGQSYVNSIEVS